MNYISMKQHTTTYTQKGFSLIETLIGISIFLIVFIGFSEVSRKSLENIDVTKRKITAQYLAEEGVEYVKQIQKSYILQGKKKQDFLQEFVQPRCAIGCDFYISNPHSENNPAIDDSGLFITEGAPIGTIGVAIFTGNPNAPIPQLSVFKFGALALSNVYDTAKVSSPYARLVTIQDIPGQDPNRSQALKVVSTVYIQPLGSTTQIPTAVAEEIIHFDFP